MSDCNCEICGEGPPLGPTVYRTGPMGGEPNWRCKKHLPEDKQPDADTMELIKILEK